MIFFLQLVGRSSYKLSFLVFKIAGGLVLSSLKNLFDAFVLALDLIDSLLQLIKSVKLQRFKRYLVSFILLLIVFLPIAAFYLVVLKDLPNPHQLVTRDQALATKIYDRHGELLYTIYNGNQKRTLVSLEEIPESMVQATIAIEDRNFWQHPGFSLRGITRALTKGNFSQASFQGGSTITQQLVKNALLTSERTLSRKLKEVLLAVEVELIFSKADILQMYFNEIPYGGTAYGIEEAAQTYFGKSVIEINLAEAALLAGLPAAPTKFSPFGANPQLAFIRQNQVLQKMLEEGYLSQEEVDKARKTELVLKSQTDNIKAPHFVMFVKDKLVETYGTKRVEQGGLKVTTSLDLKVQQLAEAVLTSELDKIASLRVGNGAVLVTQPSTGEILAMVGSKDYFDIKNDGNVNLTTQPRQPGSAIKPVNYAVALGSGLTPTTIIEDTPVVYRTVGSPPYAPVNYDNRFHGRVSLRTALASSYNVPAVKTLAALGVNKMLDQAEKMGITTWGDRSRFGLSLTLGGGEVKMTDLATVYGALANQGLRVDLNAILKVDNFQDNALYKLACEPQFNLLPQVEASGTLEFCQPQPVLDPAIAYQLTDILADNQARVPAFGLNSLLNIPGHQVAVKTGTTNDKRDNWTIGYTPDLLVAVWVGNNDNSPMSAVASGVTGASPIWNKVMTALLDKLDKAHAFSPPPQLKAVSVCAFNGLLPCQGCPTKTEYFVAGTEPKAHCQVQKKQPDPDQSNP